MAIMTWRRPAWPRSPWPDLGDFERAMARLWGETRRVHAGHPPVNLWTGTDDIILTAELPGVEPQDLDISVQEDSLMLRCAPKEREASDETVFHRRERTRAAFARSWQLPFEVDGDHIEARIENGILQLRLPRAQAGKPRKIPVKAAEKGGRTA